MFIDRGRNQRRPPSEWPKPSVRKAMSVTEDERLGTQTWPSWRRAARLVTAHKHGNPNGGRVTRTSDVNIQ